MKIIYEIEIERSSVRTDNNTIRTQKGTLGELAEYFGIEPAPKTAKALVNKVNKKYSRRESSSYSFTTVSILSETKIKETRRKYADYTYKTNSGVRIRVLNRGKCETTGKPMWDADISNQNESYCSEGACAYYTKKALIQQLTSIYGKLTPYVGSSEKWTIGEKEAVFVSMIINNGDNSWYKREFKNIDTAVDSARKALARLAGPEQGGSYRIYDKYGNEIMFRIFDPDGIQALKIAQWRDR